MSLDNNLSANTNNSVENGFSFVLTEQKWLDIIRDSIIEKWNSTDTVLILTAELNCACGVTNGHIFLTAGSEAADSSYASFRNMTFFAVFTEENKAGSFDADISDSGGYSITKTDVFNYELVHANKQELEAAVAFYRNQQAKKAFIDSHENWAAYKNECYERFRAQFPKILEDIYKRIPDVDLRDSLTKLVDTAEAVAAVSNVQFGEPATDDEIAACEERLGIKLPSEFIGLMKFANGFDIGMNTCIYTLAGIGSERKWLDEDGFEGYNDIGSIIGDGTLICLDPDGKNYSEWQDGDMSSIGDFNKLIEMLCYLNL